MDLSTTYLGLNLQHPIMPGASPLVDDLDMVRRLEDAGASAIVMHSLFEEQIQREQQATFDEIEAHTHAHAEAASYFPEPHEYALGPAQYLEQIGRIKNAVRIPVIASLNGTTATGWLDYARLIQQAGADALELNVYYLATDPSESGSQVEQRTLEIVREVRKNVTIPIAAKISPFFSSLVHFAADLDEAGADGLVLFNRFYQPDIDIESLEVVPRLHLSDSSELLLRIRWLAVLSGRVWASLGVSGGVHTTEDAVKSIMAGAHGVQMVSSLLLHGPGHLKIVLDGLKEWMERHEYESVAQMRGSMRLAACPNPGSIERANYMRILQGPRMASLNRIDH